MNQITQQNINDLQFLFTNIDYKNCNVDYSFDNVDFKTQLNVIFRLCICIIKSKTLKSVQINYKSDNVSNTN